MARIDFVAYTCNVPMLGRYGIWTKNIQSHSLLGGDAMRADNPLSAWITVMTMASYAWVLALRSTPVTGSDPTSTT